VFNSPFFTYFWRFAGAFSVRSKIMGIVVALALLLGVGITVQVRTVFLYTLEERLQEQSISVARDVAARATDMILVNDLFALYQLLEETRNNNPDLRYAFVVGHDGTRVSPHLWRRLSRRTGRIECSQTQTIITKLLFADNGRGAGVGHGRAHLRRPRRVRPRWFF
jgi:hypothetical protein